MHALPSEQDSCTRSKPNPIRSHPSRSVSIRARSNSNAMRSDAGSAPIRHGSKQNRKKMSKVVILPSARLPRAFRVPSGTAPFGCAQFRPGSAATRLGSVPFRLGSDSFWRGSALLGTGSARLRFVNELFFSPRLFQIKCPTAIYTYIYVCILFFIVAHCTQSRRP